MPAAAEGKQHLRTLLGLALLPIPVTIRAKTEADDIRLRIFTGVLKIVSLRI
jgi:hypothetical protein